MFYFITHKPVDDISDTVDSEFGTRFPPKDGATSEHKGIDFAVSSGTQVYAAHNGTVTRKDPNDPNGGGKVIFLERKDDFGNKYSTRYLHLSKFGTIKDKTTGEVREIRKGDEIQGGQPIALSGNTGSASSGPHLHFTVVVNGEKQNPREYLAYRFRKEFATTVKSENYGMELTGDFRPNILVANSRSNTLKGKENRDYYLFSRIAGEDVIIDSDGVIVIGGKLVENDGIVDSIEGGTTLTGSISYKLDTSNNKLDNVWTSEGYDFYRVSATDGSISGEGEDLVIIKSTDRFSASAKNKITIKNFPFEKDKAFGFSLGKIQEGTENSVKLFPKPYIATTNGISRIESSALEDGGFFALTRSGTDVADSITKFDAYSNVVSAVSFDEAFSDVYAANGSVDLNGFQLYSSLYSYEVDGKKYNVWPLVESGLYLGGY